MKLLLLLIALSVSACTAQWKLTDSYGPTTFEIACSVLEVDYEGVCNDLDEPFVLIAMTPALHEAFGFYIPGVSEAIIYVLPQWFMDELESQGVAVPSQRSVIIHETIHYILDFGGITSDRCPSEAAARKYTAIATGEPEDPTWRKRYGCVSRLSDLV